VGDRADAPYLTSEERAASLGPPRTVTVPGPWQAQLDDLRLWAGVAWYERDFVVPEEWEERRVRLCFGAVDYHCSVWVNGEHAGGHEGGYLPFDFDVTSLVRSERNLLTVRVIDPGPQWQSESFPFDEIPHGKQSWYGPLGGLWQSVYLEATSSSFVRQVSARGDLASGEVRLEGFLHGALSGGERLHYHVTSPDGLTSFSLTGAPFERGQTSQAARVRAEDVQAWAPDTPRLYSLVVELEAGGRTVDSWSDEFGFRSIAARDGRLFLNGRPLYIRGALDQDYYLPTISTPPSDELLFKQVMLAKELGLNLLRCHIKVPDPRYLRCADRLGILLWCELPNWITLTPNAKRRAEETLQGILERDGNHPSIVIWTIINEGWGVDLPNEADHRSWMRAAFDRLKRLDDTRLVVDNSPCPPNFHVRTDINDFHFYRAIPDREDEWRRLTAGWVADPASTFSSHGDAERDGDEPQVVSELGNWGLPDTRLLLDDEGRAPWWFATGGEWNGGSVLPEGVEKRFDEWGLARVFGSWEEFVKVSQDHQFEGLKQTIEDMRSHGKLSGYVITELTDVHWECNGLLDMARNPKAFHHRFKEINGPDAVFALPSRRRGRAGDLLAFDVFVAHFSAHRLEGGAVRWRAPLFEAQGAARLDNLAGGEVFKVKRVELTFPEVEEARRVTVELRLDDRLGRCVTRSTFDLLVFPSTSGPEGTPLRAVGERAAETLVGRTTREGEDAGAQEVVVAHVWTDEIARHVGDGGRAVICAGEEDAFPNDLGIGVRTRRGSKWDGDWAQGMMWLAPRLRAGLPFLPRVDATFSGLTPECVLVGWDEAHNEDMLAGLYVGWLRYPVATVGLFRYGQGVVVACTFPLLEAAGRDPLADALLDRLAALVAAPDPGGLSL
jgi:Glycosyl hydrolases family 2, sugar binding domain/Glycosyl hydrolases family 2/Glycosyl hydrolases family 2, TIM barrel domain